MKKLSIKEMVKNRKKKGFTLIELIIVIAIIAILAAMAIPKFSAIRMESKVSNDVAAAKNIQTIAATLVANGTWKAGDSKQSSDPDIKDRLDGKMAQTGNSEATNSVFTINIGANESITVTCSGKELYPDASGQGRKDYLGIAKGGTTSSSSN